MARWTNTDAPDASPLELDEGHPLLTRGPLRQVWREWTSPTGKRVLVSRIEWGATESPSPPDGTRS